MSDLDWTAQDRGRLNALMDLFYSSERQVLMPDDLYRELRILLAKYRAWRKAQQRFMTERLLDDFEDEQAQTRILDLTIRFMAEELMTHPQYPAYREQVLRSGHLLRIDLELARPELWRSDDARFKVLRMQVYDGGPVNND